MGRIPQKPLSPARTPRNPVTASITAVAGPGVGGVLVQLLTAITAGKGTFEFFQWGIIALFILYGVRELGLSAAEIGAISVIGSFGPLLAGLITPRISQTFGTTWTSIVGAVLLGGNLLIPLAAGPDPVVIITIGFGQFLLGLGVVYLIIVLRGWRVG